MKRSRDNEEEEVKGKNDEPTTKLVFIVSIGEDHDFKTFRADLTQAELDLLAPRFVRSGPNDRESEVSTNGPAAAVLRKIMEYRVDPDDGAFGEFEGWVEASSAFVSENAAHTIVWFDFE